MVFDPFDEVWVGNILKLQRPTSPPGESRPCNARRGAGEHKNAGADDGPHTDHGNVYKRQVTAEGDPSLPVLVGRPGIRFHP